MFQELGYPLCKNIAEQYEDDIAEPHAHDKTKSALMANRDALLDDGENDRAYRQCENDSQR
jgi:hypothetical protein